MSHMGHLGSEGQRDEGTEGQRARGEALSGISARRLGGAVERLKYFGTFSAALFQSA
jgi:hypothetical protein